MASKYYHLSPFSYTANNPILFIDPDGQKIVISNNTSTALTNLAMIAATSQGRERINRLISSPEIYTTKSVFWTRSSKYDGLGQEGPSRTVYFVGSSWMFSIDGGAASSMYVMGHELDHAYQHCVTDYCPIGTDKNRERSAVNFGNYLASVYGDGDKMRTRYFGMGLDFSNNEKVYNPNNEKVNDFTQTLDVSFNGNTVMGFSYSSSENGEDAKTTYMLSLKTESGQYAYRIFTDKKEYDEAVKRVQALKNKENENK
jgi:hypothetical protein